MDMTNLQHFEQAVNEASTCFAGVWPHHSTFDFLFMTTILAETSKCRMNEDHKKLILNAGRAMVAKHRREFDAHFRKAVGFFYWEEKDYEQLAVDVSSTVPRIQSGIVNALYFRRNDLFTNPVYREYLTDYEEIIEDIMHEDHPMRTFNYWIDYLEQMKDVANYKTWFFLKRYIVSLIRIGNAVIPRSEWEPRVTVLPSFFEQVQL